jgi:hypothetical protein
MMIWAFPFGSGYTLIRLQALSSGPVSAPIPNAKTGFGYTYSITS